MGEGGGGDIGSLRRAHAQRRCEAESWIGRRFSDGEMRFDLIEPRSINLYDVATHVILPATHGCVLADGQTKPSYVELVAEGAQRPHYFASHSWAALAAEPAGRAVPHAPTTWRKLLRPRGPGRPWP